MAFMYARLIIIFAVYVGVGGILTWLLFKLACALDDIRYLADVAEAKGAAVERKRSPLRYVVLVAGIIAVLLSFCLVFRIGI